MRTQYLVSGLTVLSDHELSIHMAHGWQKTHFSPNQIDITITLNDPSDRPESSSPRSGKDFFFSPKSGLDFRIYNGTNISIYRSAEIGDRDVTIFLIGSAWGVLCHQRGLLPLHCSAVASSSKAFAFIAQSGGGKSTLAASLCQCGYDHVCDDVAIIDAPKNGAVSLRAMPKGLKLWREATEALGLEPRELVTNDETIEKYYVDLPSASSSETLSLEAIYILNFDDDITEPQVTPVRGSILLQNLYINIYRVEWVNQIGDPAKVLSKIRRIAEETPVYQFSRPRALENLQASAEFLSNHFSKAG